MSGEDEWLPLSGILIIDNHSEAMLISTLAAGHAKNGIHIINSMPGKEF